jgi:hypothetical protein
VRLGGLAAGGGCVPPELVLPSRGAALSVRLRRTVPGRLRPFRKLHGVDGWLIFSSYVECAETLEAVPCSLRWTITMAEHVPN